jgi:hypothetical protein
MIQKNFIMLLMHQKRNCCFEPNSSDLFVFLENDTWKRFWGDYRTTTER